MRCESARSLGNYLGHVVLDSRPEPLSWGFCWEPWQRGIVAPILPAIEYMAGVAPVYSGPRNFFLVLPRGHDKTGLIGRLSNWAVAYARNPISGVAAAATREQAALLLESMKAEMRLNPWLAERLRPQNYAMCRRGGRLKVISADAPHSSGLKCDLIVCDELTFWDSRDLFDVLYSGREKRPASVFIIITNAGIRGSWQWDVLEKAKADPVNWRVFETPADTQLASWMDAEKIEGLRALIPRGHARRVLDNHWIDTTETPLLDFDVIRVCVGDCLWPNGICPPQSRPELYVGIDVGRTHDKTVIWTLELVGDVAWTREIKVLHEASFAEQKHAMQQRITRHVIAARIDKGGVGMQLSEELAREFVGIVQGVALSAGKQGQLALALQTAFQGQRIRIPDDGELIADLQLIDEIETGAGGTPIIKTNHGPTGHGDRFWAAALALSGIPFHPPKRPAGLPRAFIPRAATK